MGCHRLCVGLVVMVLFIAGCATTRETATRTGETVHEDAGRRGETRAPDEMTGQESEMEAAAGEEPDPDLQIDEKKETVSIIEVIESLERTYLDGDFETWLSLLTPRYRAKYDQPDILRKEGWDAKDLRSFFELLVETRRSENIGSLEISRVDFVSPRKAHVFVLFKGEEFPEPQHTFIRMGGSWYKGLREEEG
jgi:hypothetical protein